MSGQPGNKKLYQQVACAVGEAIRRGEHAPGSRLPSERELAEAFGVSRPTVREAMVALEIQGFLEIRHGSGIHVTGRAPKSDGGLDLDVGPFELIEARRAVESEACALAAISITDTEIADLERLLAEMERGSSVEHDPGAGPSEAERADRRFHVLIGQATRNSALAGVVEMLWDLRYRSPLCVEILARAHEAGDRPPDRRAPRDRTSPGRAGPQGGEGGHARSPFAGHRRRPVGHGERRRPGGSSEKPRRAATPMPDAGRSEAWR